MSQCNVMKSIPWDNAIMRTHQELDKRSLALHCLIADKIRHEPHLFDKPKQTLARWNDIVCASSLPYVQEWQRLVDLGMKDCLAVATEDSQRAIALRQTSPFCGVLTHKERFAFFRDWSKVDHETR